jgi:hypothetical protein
VVTLSPLPGSRDASPRTQISFLGVPAAALSAISVVGSQTGPHSGRLAPYSQGDGASYLPARPFAEGERVTVSARLRRGRSSSRLVDRFAIARMDPISATPEHVYPGVASEVQGFHSRPDLHPPVVAVTTQSPAAAPGDVFVAPHSGPGQAGPMILDQSGRLIWFDALKSNSSATNFRVQEYLGQPVLTWWHGDISGHGFGLGEDVIDDSSYRTIARVSAGNGYRADLHEFQLTPHGTALLTAYSPIFCDLSAEGGPANGAVTDGVLQEIDVRTGMVRFEWTSIDHVALGESYERASTSTTIWPFDFFHINSINLDPDGTLLVSARNTWTVYEIDARSGQVRWRLGGRQSSFTEGPGTRTAWQHDPRLLPNGSLSIFDNGAAPALRTQSRGVVLGLDQQHRTTTVISQYTHGPPLLADSQGNMQALVNGDWFFGWGQVPYFSEYSTGTPVHPPTFVLQSSPGPTVYASWNGATLVASWNVLAGRTPASMQLVARAPRGGFETALPLPAGTVGPDVAVQALDSSGRVLGTSATVAEPGLG